MKRDWVNLPKPWAELRSGLRDEVAAKAGDIHTYDGGHVTLVNGRWEVVYSGHANDADMVLNALRKPN